ADGGPERHGATVDVDPVLVHAELLGRVQGDGGEGLVDLVEVEGGGVDAELRRRLGGGVGGLGREGGIRAGDHAVGNDRGEDREAVPLRPLPAGDDEGSGAVGDLRGVGGGDRPLLREGGTHLGDALGGHAG